MCPSTRKDCRAVAHISCLAKDFLQNSTPGSSSSPATKSELIPRGGECRSCHEYVLWGDVIRGCYRRAKGGVVEPDEEDADDDENVSELYGSASELETDDDAEVLPTVVTGARRKGKAAASLKTQRKAAPVAGPSKPKPSRRSRKVSTSHLRAYHTSTRREGLEQVHNHFSSEPGLYSCPTLPACLSRFLV